MVFVGCARNLGAPLNSMPGEAAAIFFLSTSKLPALSQVNFPQPRAEIGSLRHVAITVYSRPTSS